MLAISQCGLSSESWQKKQGWDERSTLTCHYWEDYDQQFFPFFNSLGRGVSFKKFLKSLLLFFVFLRTQEFGGDQGLCQTQIVLYALPQVCGTVENFFWVGVWDGLHRTSTLLWWASLTTAQVMLPLSVHTRNETIHSKDFALIS